jgi:hypothetical protein
MKFNRLLVALILGLSFFATSPVYASDNGGGQQSHSTMLGWLYNLITGQGGYSDGNRGKECDHGHGNDSSGCPAKSGGSTSGGSTSGGGTVGPKG